MINKEVVPVGRQNRNYVMEMITNNNVIER